MARRGDVELVAQDRAEPLNDLEDPGGDQQGDREVGQAFGLRGLHRRRSVMVVSSSTTCGALFSASAARPAPGLITRAR